MIIYQRASDLPPELAERRKLLADYDSLGDTWERRIEIYKLRSAMITKKYEAILSPQKRGDFL